MCSAAFFVILARCLIVCLFDVFFLIFTIVGDKFLRRCTHR